MNTYGNIFIYNIDLKEFRKWLLSKEDYYPVGTTCSSIDCPIRNYLTVDDYTVIAVEEQSILCSLPEGRMRFGIQREVKKFINMLDHATDLKPVLLRAEEVLLALDSFYPELAEEMNV